MISEHKKLVMRHLGIDSEDYTLSEELDKFISDMENLMQAGCQRNNFGRDTIVAMLAVIKLLGKEKMLEPIKRKKDVPEEEEVVKEEAQPKTKAKGKY